jgi:putative transposase
VPLARGFLYLAAILDWFSRSVLAWRLSKPLDGSFCLEMLDEALSRGRPEVGNTDQGVPFPAQAWTGRLESAGVAVSRDGRGRCLDNVFVERLGRTVQEEDIYLWRYETVPQLQQGLGRYFPYANAERLHQALDYRTPAAVYRPRRACVARPVKDRPSGSPRRPSAPVKALRGETEGLRGRRPGEDRSEDVAERRSPGW